MNNREEAFIRSITYNHARLLIYASLFAILTFVGALIRLPFLPAPISLQTFFVVLSGLALGPRYGAASQLLYLFLGLAGLPIFANGGGPAYVLQPTFGYLLGFPAASYFAGRMVHGTAPAIEPFRPVKPLRLFLIALLALMLVFIPGVVYLWFNLNYLAGGNLTIAQAFMLGAAVFLPGDVIKAAVLVALYRLLQQRFAARGLGVARPPAHTIEYVEKSR